MSAEQGAAWGQKCRLEAGGAAQPADWPLEGVSALPPPSILMGSVSLFCCLCPESHPMSVERADQVLHLPQVSTVNRVKSVQRAHGDCHPLDTPNIRSEGGGG
jgi:hypothetical protein